MGLTHVALSVRDADRSAAFYKQVFGAVEVYRQDGFVQLQTPARETSWSSNRIPSAPAAPAASCTSGSG